MSSIKFKANSSKHKAMSYGRLKAKEAELVEALIKKTETSDSEEEDAYQQETGYSIPEDLQFKQERLEKIQKAKKALEERKQALNPGKPIDDKKQISFADHDARIMGKKGSGYQYSYNAQISVDSDHGISRTQDSEGSVFGARKKWLENSHWSAVLIISKKLPNRFPRDQSVLKKQKGLIK